MIEILIPLGIAAVAIVIVVLSLERPKKRPESEFEQWKRFHKPDPITLPPPRVSGLESSQVARVIRIRPDRDGNDE